MKPTQRAIIAILIKSAVIALSYAVLNSYLLEQSHGALSQRAILLPTIFVAGALVVGIALGLWVNQRPE